MNEKPSKQKPAKMCYEHIGGKLGQLLAVNFAEIRMDYQEKPN